MRFADSAQLARLLTYAQVEHHAYEEEERRKRHDPLWSDPVWHEWYAEFIAKAYEVAAALQPFTRDVSENPMSERDIEDGAAIVSREGYGHGV